MNKRLTVKELNGVKVLHLNDKPAQCPFRNPFPMPHPITGRVDFNLPICGDDCQFFNFHHISTQDGQTLNAVYFDCTGCDKTVEI